MKKICMLLGALVFAAGTNCSSTKKLANREAELALAKMQKPIASEIIQPADVDSLPAPVKRFLYKSGVVGKEHLKTVRAKFSGRMKVGGEKAKWVKVKVVQHSFLDTNLTRIFYIKTRMFGFIPVIGRDKFQDGKGNMLIKIADLFTVVNQTGPIMDKSALVTFLNDLSFFPSGMVNKKITWKPIDDFSARAILTDYGITVSGIFYFDKDDNLINFETDDRTYDDGRGDIRKAKWWTPFRGSQVLNGIRVPFEGDAEWDFGDHKFNYARFHIDDVEFNKFELYK